MLLEMRRTYNDWYAGLYLTYLLLKNYLQSAKFIILQANNVGSWVYAYTLSTQYLSRWQIYAKLMFFNFTWQLYNTSCKISWVHNVIRVE